MLEKASQSLKSSQRMSNACRWLFMVIVIAIIGTISWFIYTQYQRIQSQKFRDELSAAMTAKWEQRQPELMKEGMDTFSKASPVVMKAFQDQFNKDSNKFSQALDKEYKPLMDNLQKKLNEKMAEHQKKMTAEFEGILKAEFKDETPETIHKITANFEAAVIKKSKELYADPLQSELQKLAKSYEDFPVAPAPKKDDPPLSEQFIGHLMEILSAMLGAGGKVAPK